MIPDDHVAVPHLRDGSNAGLGQFREHLEVHLALGVIALIASGIARGGRGQDEGSGTSRHRRCHDADDAQLNRNHVAASASVPKPSMKSATQSAPSRR